MLCLMVNAAILFLCDSQDVSQIQQLRRLRPPRIHLTRCLYIYGPGGTGKSVAVSTILNTIQRHNPKLDFYMKLNGYRKYWDNYDNQPFVWIEDPGAFDTRFNVDDVNAFKMLISTGACLQEVKYGSVQFDSYLVIVTSNVAPYDLALSAGPTSYQPVMDRVDGNRAARKSIFANTKEYVRGKMYKDIITVIYSICHAHNLGTFDFNSVYDECIHDDPYQLVTIF